MSVNKISRSIAGSICVLFACIFTHPQTFAGTLEKKLKQSPVGKRPAEKTPAQDESLRTHLKSVIEINSFDAKKSSQEQNLDFNLRFENTKKTLDAVAPAKKILNLELNKDVIDGTSARKDAKSVQLESAPDILDALNQQDIFNIAKALQPNAKPMSIESVRQKALSQNLSLNITLLDPEIAQTFVSQERAKFDQVIFANAQVVDMNQEIGRAHV